MKRIFDALGSAWSILPEREAIADPEVAARIKMLATDTLARAHGGSPLLPHGSTLHAEWQSSQPKWLVVADKLAQTAQELLVHESP